MRCPFAPINIDKLETIQKMKNKFLKIGFGQATEIELWHFGHEIITRYLNTQLHNPATDAPVRSSVRSEIFVATRAPQFPNPVGGGTFMAE